MTFTTDFASNPPIYAALVAQVDAKETRLTESRHSGQSLYLGKLISTRNDVSSCKYVSSSFLTIDQHQSLHAFSFHRGQKE
ncbi:hypothetical protein ABKN59_002354 [Abortiporus biennis]